MNDFSDRSVTHDRRMPAWTKCASLPARVNRRCEVADQGIGPPSGGEAEGAQRVVALLGWALLMSMAGRRDAVLELVGRLDPQLFAAAVARARAGDLGEVVEAARRLLDGADEALALGDGKALAGDDRELLGGEHAAEAGANRKSVAGPHGVEQGPLVVGERRARRRSNGQ